MGQLGVVELTVVSLLSLITLVIPAATLVVAILIYGKLSRIEKTLDRRE